MLWLVRYIGTNRDFGSFKMLNIIHLLALRPFLLIRGFIRGLWLFFLTFPFVLGVYIFEWEQTSSEALVWQHEVRGPPKVLVWIFRYHDRVRLLRLQILAYWSCNWVDISLVCMKEQERNQILRSHHRNSGSRQSSGDFVYDRRVWRSYGCKSSR